MWAWPRMWLSSAPSTRTNSTVSPATSTTAKWSIKYEIENFKDKAVVLDVSENVRAIRNELSGDNGRDVQWELGKATTFAGRAGQGKEHLRAVALPRSAPRPRRRRARRIRSSTSSTSPSKRVVKQEDKPMRNT